MVSRRKMKRSDGWGFSPKLDEARVAAPEVPATQRAKKDRRRWCRGKVGVEHVHEPRYSKWAVYWAARDNKAPKCEWKARGRYVKVAGQRFRTFVPDGTFEWSCKHDDVCVNCGKIFDQMGRKCPEFHPHEHDWKRRE